MEMITTKRRFVEGPRLHKRSTDPERPKPSSIFFEGKQKSYWSVTRTRTLRTLSQVRFQLRFGNESTGRRLFPLEATILRPEC